MTTSDTVVVSTTSGSGFTAALFVRDRFGLPFAEEVPPLTPAVAPDHSALRAPVTAVAWERWWDALRQAGAGTLVLPSDDTLADLLERVRSDATTWGETEADEAATAYRPPWLASLLRAGGAGRHDTEVLPVSGAWVMAVDDRRVLVSTETCRDHGAMDALWRARIGALVGE